MKETKDAVHSGYWSLYRYSPLLREKGKESMILDFKRPDFSLMKKFMRQQVRFASLESSQPDTAKLLSNKTISNAKRRFYNYVRLVGQEEKIRAKLEKQSESEINTPENEKPRVKKERVVNSEAEARRAARRAKRVAKRKQHEQD